LEDKNNYLVCHLKYSLTFVLLLQMIDTEDNRSVVSTPGCKNNNFKNNNNSMYTCTNVLCILIRCLDEIVHDKLGR
jgi:hypothetical protein